VTCGALNLLSIERMALSQAIAFGAGDALASTPQSRGWSSGGELPARLVARFAESEGIAVVGEFTEVETGKGADA
jgi:hypothetical protein